MLKFLTLLLASSAAATRSAKRGLIFIPNSNWPQDDSIWVQGGSDLTWYYNYGQAPSAQFSNIPQSQLEFVPQRWGINSNPEDTSFSQYVTQLMDSGTNIKAVLGYNEPNFPHEWGGSQIAPIDAARGWIADFIPLQQKGLKIGLPAVSGSPDGLVWLEQFIGNCTNLLAQKGAGSECPYDFLPVHWYDNFGGLQSHINEAISVFPNAKIWVTEFAYANQNLQATQDYYSQAVNWLDGFDKIERYSYFGAFRSEVSNVGVNATFLNNNGQLTDIGSWYLGGGATGVVPTSG
ncbi:glycoside hydrolase family 128 protein [Xylaria cf. heliscus]|nr:glycoside hydrolase family 128 protein [Xylaria cf. heliscus]